MWAVSWNWGVRAMLIVAMLRPASIEQPSHTSCGLNLQ